MKNDDAAEVLREYIRTNSPCNGLEAALQRAITALLHQPEPQPPTIEIGDSWETYKRIKGTTTRPSALQCWNCDAIIDDIDHAVCPMCGSSNLRPVSEIGRKA